MDKKEKYVLMAKIVRELEDLKNSQTSVMKKVGQLETENINLVNKILSSALPDIYEHISENLERVEALSSSFSAATEKFGSENGLSEEDAT